MFQANTEPVLEFYRKMNICQVMMMMMIMIMIMMMMLYPRCT